MYQSRFPMEPDISKMQVLNLHSVVQIKFYMQFTFQRKLSSIKAAYFHTYSNFFNKCTNCRSFNHSMQHFLFTFTDLGILWSWLGGGEPSLLNLWSLLLKMLLSHSCIGEFQNLATGRKDEAIMHFQRRCMTWRGTCKFSLV